jgi:hypothetical protein
MDAAEVLQDVQEYFYRNDSLASAFEDFVDQNCDIIDLESDEMKLQYTDLHEKFKQLFEDLMEAYIQSKGYSVLQFYSILRDKLDCGNSSDATFVFILSTITGRF